jgi:hypothetical protein
MASAEVIYPVNSQGSPDTNSPVYLTIWKNGVDITGDPDQYPVPGQPFQVKLNGATLGSVQFSSVAGVTTSAYPGVCTNFGDPTDTSLDFDPPVIISSDSFQLNPKDFGGRAVVQINNSYVFVIPQDTDLNGIPDIYEKKYGFAVGGLARDGDIDTGPDPSSTKVGDGIANIDEYRGFRVGGVYKRGDPTKKDLFVHLEETLQCTTGTIGNFTGQTGTVTLSTVFANIQDLYANVDTLPNARVHRINKDEWVDKFSSWDVNNYVTLSGTNPEQDRWINKNSIATNKKVVKGVRIIECLDLTTLSPLGSSDKNPPDLPDTSNGVPALSTYKNNGTAVLYTHRIVRSTLNLITNVNVPIVYYAFENGKWVSKGAVGNNSGNILNPSNPSISDATFVRLMQLLIPWYVAHEALNHAFDVTATATTTRTASYGYHHADGSGTNVDIKITNTLTSKGNNFYIPKYFGISDERDLRVLSSQ